MAQFDPLAPAADVRSDADPARVDPPQLAGLWRRFASFCYEAILVIPLLFIGAWIFTIATRSNATPWNRPLLQIWLLSILGVYFVYCWRTSGQTLAMKTWQIRVARADGLPLSTSIATARYLLGLWSLLLCGAGFVWALVDRERQFLHDRLVGTRLVVAR
ncbi:MAG: RDD family protein [Proteobacteria bacterium]|nr:MAG: RDD family protein [Pseudomonadota bacterium]